MEKKGRLVVDLRDQPPKISSNICYYDFINPEITGGRSKDIAISAARLEPGRWTYFHYHDMDEAFYVLKGRVAFEIDGEIYNAEENSTVLVPAKVKHKYRSLGPDYGFILIIGGADDWRYEGPKQNSYKLSD
jgi:quercetin dioxygenase-like cupin family protein